LQRDGFRLTGTISPTVANGLLVGDGNDRLYGTYSDVVQNINENMFTAAGLSVWPIFVTASGKTVTTAEGIRIDSGGSSGAGTITTAIGIHVLVPGWTAATTYSAVFEGNVRVNGVGTIAGGSWGSTSDPRLKRDIAPMNETHALELIGAGQVYRFRYRPEMYVNRTADTRVHTGFLATDVEKLYPDAVMPMGDMELHDGSVVPGVMGVAQDDLQNLGLAAIKALLRRVEAAEARLSTVEARAAAQDQRILALEQRLNACGCGA
jgi:hypothetical protein